MQTDTFLCRWTTWLSCVSLLHIIFLATVCAVMHRTSFLSKTHQETNDRGDYQDILFSSRYIFFIFHIFSSPFFTLSLPFFLPRYTHYRCHLCSFISSRQQSWPPYLMCLATRCLIMILPSSTDAAFRCLKNLPDSSTPMGQFRALATALTVAPDSRPNWESKLTYELNEVELK